VLTLYYPRTRPHAISAILVRMLADAREWCMEWDMQEGLAGATRLHVAHCQANVSSGLGIPVPEERFD